jgi:hypothetical protein
MSRQFEMRSGLILSLAIALTGCGAAMVDALNRGDHTGKPFSQLSSSFKPTTDDRGRVFVYRTRASTTVESEFNKVMTKNVFYCLLGERLQKILWEVFLPIEWSAGEYEFSCGGVLVSTDYFGNEAQVRRGTQRVMVTLAPGKDVYIRLDLVNNVPTPVVVSPEVARSEMSDLPIQLQARPHAAGRVQ